MHEYSSDRAGQGFPDRLSEELRNFHDQKSGDFDPDTGVVITPDSGNDIYHRHSKFVSYSEAVKVVGEANEVVTRIHDVVSLISNTQLKEEFKNDSLQQQLLEKKKEMVKKLINSCLSSAVRYIDSIREMSSVKIAKEAGDRDQAEKLESADRARKLSHNALLDELRIVNRFCRQNFSKLPESELENYRKSEKAAGRQFLEVERVDLPKNIIAVDSIDVNHRGNVRDWALVISSHLEEIKKELL